MNEKRGDNYTLTELHIKGELAERGFLKETYSEEKGDLDHKITDKGMHEIRIMLRDPKYRKEFMLMALQEAKNHPEQARAIVQAALNKLNGL